MTKSQQGTGDEALMDAYFEGTASELEQAQLEIRLRVDPETARAFLAAARLDRGLDVVFRRDKHPAPPTLSSVPRSRVLTFAAIGACAALVLAFGLRFQTTSPWPTQRPSFVTNVRPQSAVPAVGPVVGVPLVSPDGALTPFMNPLLKFDFEQKGSAAAYPVWLGNEGPCPPGREGKRCLGGLRMPLRDDQFGVSLGDWKRSFFDYSDDLQIRFSYWVGATTTLRIPITIAIHVGTGTEAEAFRLDAEASGSVHWVDIQVPVSAARGWHSHRPLRSGDRINAVHVTVPFAANDVFFIDDFAVGGSSVR